MNTLTMIENALKSVYLGAVTELLNTKVNPLLSKIEQTTAGVWGKEIVEFVGRYRFTSTLKNVYYRLEFSDKILSASYGDMSIITNLLNQEFENLLSDSRFNIGRMLYGDGTNNEITGLGAIFGTGELYGAQRESDFMRPKVKTNAGAFNEAMVREMIDCLEKKANSTVDFIAVSADVKRAYLAYMRQYERNVDIIELNGGFKSIVYNGIPVVYDRFVEPGTMYFLNTSAFKLHQLCDWRYLETENGKILRQTEGKPTYTLTLVKYCDLICHYPGGQGKITGITG